MRACSGFARPASSATILNASRRARRSKLIIVNDIRNAQFRQAVLPRAEEFARTSQLQVLLRDAKAVVGRQMMSSRFAASSHLGSAKRKQYDGLLPAPDPPAKLVQLRQPEPLRVLDDHDRRVRDVNADLDDDRGDQDVIAPRAEFAPSRGPSRRGRIRP